VREPRRRPSPQAVSDSLDGELSVEALARLVGLSASYFARSFRRVLAVAPRTYIFEARVERAKKLLRETDLSLVEVALAVGFSSRACLNVAFRRHGG
jgi:AraC family transcriptional regulator